MVSGGPFDLLVLVVDILDALDLPYALGGSVAGSIVGEPRSTNDVDLAVRLDAESGEALIARLPATLYVPVVSARRAIVEHGSFNVLDVTSTMKVDVFIAGTGLLDRRQLERRVRSELPGTGREVWVTSPEDMVLRKLDWHRQTGSERQWRDVIGILEVQGDHLDLEDVREAAAQVGLGADLRRALAEAGSASI